MSFGFPAYHTEQFSVGTGQSRNLHSPVRKTLSELSWTIKEDKDNQIVAATRVTIRSWGEIVLISFLPDNSLSVTSKCTSPAQCFDWGKNKSNVVKFIEAIQKTLNP